MEVDLPNLLRDKDRHGTERIYYRPPKKNGKRTGKMVRLWSTPGTPEFIKEYRDAVEGRTKKTEAPPPPPKALAKSLRWLIEAYYESARFKTLALSTRTARKGILESICESETETKAGKKKRGDLGLDMRRRHVVAIRDEKIDFPEAANSRVKALGQVYDWALKEEIEGLEIDPTNDVELLPPINSDGFHTWTVEEVWQYYRRWPLGTRQRVAIDVLLYTGTRRSDGVRLGKQFERDGWLHFTEVKNSKSRALGRKKKPPRPKKRSVPILPILEATLQAGPTGEMVWIVSAHGRPLKETSFGNSFRDWCNAAGLPHCAAHGLRKAGATIASENGATSKQLMAIYGWEKIEQAELYTRAADRVRLAGDAMGLIALPPDKNKQRA